MASKLGETQSSAGDLEDGLKGIPLTDPCEDCVCTEGCNKFCEEEKNKKKKKKEKVTERESLECHCKEKCVKECEGPTSAKQPVLKEKASMTEDFNLKEKIDGEEVDLQSIIEDLIQKETREEQEEDRMIEDFIFKEKGEETEEASAVRGKSRGDSTVKEKGGKMAKGKGDLTSCKGRASKIPIRKKSLKNTCEVCVCEDTCSPDCELNKKIKGICNKCECIGPCNSNCERVLISKGLFISKIPPKICVVCKCDSGICGTACSEAKQNKNPTLLNKTEISEKSESYEESETREETTMASLEISQEHKICKDCRCDSGICNPLCAEARRIRNLLSRQPIRDHIDIAPIELTSSFTNRQGVAPIDREEDIVEELIVKIDIHEPCDCKPNQCIPECPDIAAKKVIVEDKKYEPCDCKPNECIPDCPDIASKEAFAGDIRKNLQSDFKDKTKKNICSCRGTDEHKIMPSKKEACAKCMCTGPCNRTCEEVMKIKAVADWPAATVCEKCECEEGLCNAKCLSKKKANYMNETVMNKKIMATASKKSKINRKCQCSLTSIQESPVPNEPHLSKSSKVHKKCQCTTVFKNDDNMAYMSELDDIMNNIRSSCVKAESLTQEKRQEPKTTYEDFDETFVFFQQKCKMKDGFIDAMIADLRRRTTSNVFDNLLKNIANYSQSVPDFNRTLIANALTRPTLPKKCLCASNRPSNTSEQTSSTKARLCNCTIIENEKQCPPDPLEISSVKRLGVATLMVSWIASKDSKIIGYEVYVDGKINGRTSSRTRTSIVLDCLDLKNNVVINVYALTEIGKCEPPASATFVPSCHC